jgi:hypothetical protein
MRRPIRLAPSDQSRFRPAGRPECPSADRRSSSAEPLHDSPAPRFARPGGSWYPSWASHPAFQHRAKPLVSRPNRLENRADDWRTGVSGAGFLKSFSTPTYIPIFGHSELIISVRSNFIIYLDIDHSSCSWPGKLNTPRAARPWLTGSPGDSPRDDGRSAPCGTVRPAVGRRAHANGARAAELAGVRQEEFGDIHRVRIMRSEDLGTRPGAASYDCVHLDLEDEDDWRDAEWLKGALVERVRCASIIQRMGKYLWPKVYPAWHMPVGALGMRCKASHEMVF